MWGLKDKVDEVLYKSFLKYRPPGLACFVRKAS